MYLTGFAAVDMKFQSRYLTDCLISLLLQCDDAPYREHPTIFLQVCTISQANSYIYFRNCGYVSNSKVNKIFVFCH